MNSANKFHTEKEPLRGNPFDLAEAQAYALWRQRKLDAGAVDEALSAVTIQDPYALQEAERRDIIARCRQHNLAIYQLADPSQQDKTLVHELGRQLGLTRLDRKGKLI